MFHHCACEQKTFPQLKANFRSFKMAVAVAAMFVLLVSENGDRREENKILPVSSPANKNLASKLENKYRCYWLNNGSIDSKLHWLIHWLTGRLNQLNEWLMGLWKLLDAMESLNWVWFCWHLHITTRLILTCIFPKKSNDVGKWQTAAAIWIKLSFVCGFSWRRRTFKLSRVLCDL